MGVALDIRKWQVQFVFVMSLFDRVITNWWISLVTIGMLQRQR
jgi:hypothetical protein